MMGQRAAGSKWCAGVSRFAKSAYALHRYCYAICNSITVQIHYKNKIWICNRIYAVFAIPMNDGGRGDRQPAICTCLACSA